MNTEQYFEQIEEDLKKAYDVANAAREKGYDPEPKVDIPLVKDMAQRVEGIISVVAPQIIGSGVAERIKELEKQYASLDWRVALTIALEIAEQKYCEFKDKLEAMTIGIRAGLTYITLGVVSSPLEGFVELKLKQTRDGKEYFAMQFAGPIRSAGGTGASVSVIIADYVRKKMGYAEYDPTEEEIKRMVQELYDYHDRITNLQYLPSEEEIAFLTRQVPIQIDGPASEKIEVWNFKDLPRIETNQIRNGVCLVVGEGIAQKAPKLWKQLSNWGKDFDLAHWSFLEEFLALQKKIKAKGKESSEEEEKISPDYTFIKDIVAGRPVFTHPLREGGLRLRYGRSRTSGYSAASMHPASMYILNEYVATGTQLKMERPGKAACVTACDTIEGPIIKTKDGSVIHIHSLAEAKKQSTHAAEILFLGDILVSYGDFFNRAHKLVPPGYCQEWWFAELQEKEKNTEQLAEKTKIPSERAQELYKHPLLFVPTAEEAIAIATTYELSLHPFYTYHWRLLSEEKAKLLFSFFEKANVIKENEKVQKVIFPVEEQAKRILEELGMPHQLVNQESIVLEKEEARILTHIASLEHAERLKEVQTKQGDGLVLMNELSPITIKDKSGLFIGARMGRPEKAKMRKLTGSPQVLFPVGEEGGRFRCFQSSLEAGKITSEFPTYFCTSCQKEAIYPFCESCEKPTEKYYFCNPCKKLMEQEECPQHGMLRPYRKRDIDVGEYFSQSLKKLDMQAYPDLIKGVKGTSNKEHIPEHMVKGILRAKHDVYVNKDGTTRYDMTQLPLTHFKPKEIRTSVEKLKELGYEHDVFGNPLEHDEQILELKPQDVVLPACDVSPDEGADEVFFNVANFIDELLVKFYGLEPFYKCKTKEDIVGHLALALAPHTCAAITTRIIGFSQTQGFFAHPMVHAATRRDCDGDEACVTLLVDALLNFSRKFLPAHRGSTQDAPLVLTSAIKSAEVDDMVFDMDIAFSYPLAFYEACEQYKNPWDVKVEQISHRLGGQHEHDGTGFTHDTSSMNATVKCAAYKTLPSMEEKLKGQMDLAVRIRAVESSDVARLVIEKHFLKDTKGNLRKFSMQQFRCVNCNEKFRRPPLLGKCTKCKGKIIFTISEGSVIKYLDPMISLAENYGVKPYLKQTLQILQKRVESVFGKEKERQEGLGRWFG